MSEPSADAPGSAASANDGVLQLRHPGARWLSTGFDGGVRRADVAYNVTVPDGWPETDLAAYARERRERSGFDDPGPTLLTGVDQRHARLARLGPVTAVATTGLSNPAALPTDPESLRESDESTGPRFSDPSPDGDPTDPAPDDDPSRAGTVNVILHADRALGSGALANLVAVAAEAKAATLLARSGFPGTTTDAVIVGDDPTGEPSSFSGSATEVGAAARACVRDAIAATLVSRYDGESAVPEDVADAEHGVVTDCRAAVRPIEE